MEPFPVVHLQDRKKLVVIAFVVFCLFSFLILQFFRIQVLEEEKWQQKAKAQHQFVISEPFKRGSFYSNGGLSMIYEDEPQQLVVDLPMFHLYADPESIPESVKALIIQGVSGCLGWNQGEHDKGIVELSRKSRSRKLAAWVSHEQKEIIEKWWAKFAKDHKLVRNALYFVEDYKRCYPFGKLMGQVLQTIRDDKDPVTHRAIPTGGLEYYFDKLLQGKEGRRRLLRSPKYPLDRGDVIQAPEHGHDIYLTLHPYIQAIAEEELEKGVLMAEAKGGWLAIMDVHTGDILALAQYPFFYPEEYRKFYSDPQLLERTKITAITDCFEPGSIMKPISFIIALTANKERMQQGLSPLFYPKSKVDLTHIKLPGRQKPMKDVATSRFLNMDLALQKSSNIYTAGMIQSVVDSLGATWYRSQLQETFGFGKKTKIELPSEAKGFLPCPGKTYSNGKLQWSQPTPGCLAIGYNLLVNSIQVLKAYSIVANGGYDVQPSLIKKIVKKDSSEVVYERKPLNNPHRVLDPDIVDKVVHAMKLVTKPGGSASRADIPGYTEVGKTGTSEKIQQGAYAKNVHFVSFAGFAPADRAKIAIIVGIDEPAYRVIPGFGSIHYGGKCAAPVFREVGKRVLRYLGVPLDDPYGYPKGDPRACEEKADMMQEVKELKQLFYDWHR